MTITKDLLIGPYIAQLGAQEVAGLEQYEQRLRNNVNTNVFYDLLYEGRVALMFLRHGFKVTMRERPDLQLMLDQEVVYAEVKHFRKKIQDSVDEQGKTEAEDTDLLMPIEDLTISEGVPAWKQIANVAITKVPQYIEDASNILVIGSSSESLTLVLPSAVHEYDDEVLKSTDPRLRRLNAIMQVNSDIGFRQGPWNVEFELTTHAAKPLSPKLIAALEEIRLDV